MGWLFDAGIAVETLALVFAAWAFIGWLLLLVVLRRWKSAPVEARQA
jgi:hypothetical protein